MPTDEPRAGETLRERAARIIRREVYIAGDGGLHGDGDAALCILALIATDEAAVERAARAMTAKRVENLVRVFGEAGSIGWDQYTDEGKHDACEEARAALASLTEKERKS